jgi:hypothetical protein
MRPPFKSGRNARCLVSEETNATKILARKCPRSFAADAVIVLIDKPF